MFLVFIWFIFTKALHKLIDILNFERSQFYINSLNSLKTANNFHKIRISSDFAFSNMIICYFFRFQRIYKQGEMRKTLIFVVSYEIEVVITPLSVCPFHQYRFVVALSALSLNRSVWRCDLYHLSANMPHFKH